MSVCHPIPSKAEDEKGNAKESGHSVPDQGIGMAGTEVETKPEGSSKGKQLARQKIHLCGRDKGIVWVFTHDRKHSTKCLLF